MKLKICDICGEKIKAGIKPAIISKKEVCQNCYKRYKWLVNHKKLSPEMALKNMGVNN